MTTIATDMRAAVLDAVDDFIDFLNDASAKHTEKTQRTPQTYVLKGGRKYLRIASVGDVGNNYVHCFVDAATGDVYKAAGWKAPALNGARFNLLSEESYEELKRRWDPYGSYLYK